MALPWDVLPFSLVEIDGRYRGGHYLLHQAIAYMMYTVSTPWNFCHFLSYYTAQHPRWLPSSWQTKISPVLAVRQGSWCTSWRAVENLHSCHCRVVWGRRRFYRHLSRNFWYRHAIRTSQPGYFLTPCAWCGDITAGHLCMILKSAFFRELKMMYRPPDILSWKTDLPVY